MTTTEEYPFARIPAPLIDWYRKNKRQLPWRENPTPYRVWVSEIMLQQTRVEAAKEYYLRFVGCLPDVKALADCEKEKLLKLWEGLGYYSRVRNMQRTAKILCGQWGGRFPEEEKALRALPGIGDYTAGAILSIAFGQPVPAVDGNVFRVMSRLTENPTDISEPRYKSYLKEKLSAVYPPAGQGCSDFTQALMELGALVCKPLSPACGQCPLFSLCRAAEHGTRKKGKETGAGVRLCHRDACRHCRPAPGGGRVEGDVRISLRARFGRNPGRNSERLGHVCVHSGKK